MAARRPEAGEDVAGAERGEIAEPVQAEPGEEPGELGRGVAEVLQPVDGERGEEGRRLAGSDDDRAARRRSGGDRRREAPVGDADLDVGAGTAVCADGRHEPGRQRLVAAEVARRSPRREAQPARFDDVDARRELADGTHDRLERPGVAIGVVLDEHDVGAEPLRRPSQLADGDALGRRRPRPGDDVVGVQHDRRHVRGDPGCVHRPVRAPHRDDPLRPRFCVSTHDIGRRLC